MEIEAPPPNQVDILVIGGGPAGCYAAAALAREGLQVALLESSQFPRYHIGESLIPSVRHFLKFIEADSKVTEHGFVIKPGSAIKFNQYKREGYTDFASVGTGNRAWNVIRSEFDHILLKHARVSGVSVYERTRVTNVHFDDSTGRLTKVDWTRAHPSSPSTDMPEKSTGATVCRYFIDASGRAGLLSQRYLKNRRYNAALKNIALWGYWRGVNTYGRADPGPTGRGDEADKAQSTGRQGAPWFEALSDGSGWAWFIPLHNQTTSVGVVLDQKSYNSGLAADAHLSVEARYRQKLALAPGVVKLIGDGTLVSFLRADPDAEGVNATNGVKVRSASDYSYSASEYAGIGFRIVGDAGCFIDPLFSSGIHLAFTSALSAAASICAVIRGDCTESEAGKWHTQRVTTSYTRFQLVVLSAYKQIRAQKVDILSDVDEDGFDRAFALLRPVIQGASDMGVRLSETELQRALDFCVKIFDPTTPEQHARLATRADETVFGSSRLGELLDLKAPVVDPGIWEMDLGELHKNSSKNGVLHNAFTPASDEDIKMVLNKINARRVIQPEFSMNNFESEPLNGYVVRLEHGRLGLMRVET